MQPGDQIDVLESLSGLIEKSLVVTSHGTATRRYAYLETVRAYALERLRESGELAQAEAALVSYYARFVAERRPSFATKGEKAAFDEVAIEQGNIVAALDSAIERGHAEPAAAIACDLAPFWIARGLASEIQPRLDALLRSDDAYDITLRAKLWNVASLVHFRQGAIAEAARRAERALEFATESTDAGAIADALVSRARCRYSLGEFSEASDALERALPLYLQAKDRVGEARVLNFMAIVADENGDVAATDSLLRRSLAVYESCGDLQGIATVNYHLSFSAYERGDWPAAIAFSTKALDLWRECGNLQGEAWAQYNLGCAEAKQGAVESAASRLLACVRIAQRRGFQRELGDGLDRLAALLVEREPALSTRSLAYAARLRDLNGNVVLPIEREGYEACVRTARERLGPANFEIAWQQGRMDDEARLVDELASAIEETSYTTS
jgi:tetratricopeptide (TPR) repeat protein